MALNSDVLKALIITEMGEVGLVPANEYARTDALAQAIANAVVAHITSSAVVTVASGSSSGGYSVT